MVIMWCRLIGLNADATTLLGILRAKNKAAI